MIESREIADLLRLPGQGQQVGTMTIKINANALGNTFSVMENTLEPKEMIAFHIHQHEYQAVYVISGTLEFVMGNNAELSFIAPEGSYVCKPRRVQHGFWNPSETEPTRYIELSSSVGFQDFIYDTADADASEVMRAELEHQIKFDMARTGVAVAENGITSIDGGSGTIVSE